jgi:photosystem II stability/assembly factor-like uncharacterized protein
MKNVKIFTTIVFSTLAFSYTLGQQNRWDTWLNPGTDDFSTIRQNAQHSFADVDKKQRGSGYKQYKRWEYMQQHRLTEDGRIMNYAARNFTEYHDYMATLGSRGITVNHGFWYSLGPTTWINWSGWNGGLGRVNSITFHPTDANTFWVGCPAGGLWRTNNGGTNWIPLTDGMPLIGVSGLAVDYTNTNIMYLLTGDGDAADTYCIGVLKTVNGGITWNSTGLNWGVGSNVRAFKILMHPSNPAILFVASSGGLYKTSNAGESWALVQYTANHHFHDVKFKPGDPTIMYACANTKFFRSTDTGDTWSEIVSGVPTNANRMAIGISPGNASYVYLFAGPCYATSTYVGTYRSTNSGVSFSVRSTSPNILGYSSTGNDDAHQSHYDHALVVSLTDAERIMTGGINCWRSTNGGTSWTLSSMWNDPPGSTYTHADIHALEINPLNNHLYCGSDGGIFRSTDFGNNWTDLSAGLSITQIYRIAGYQPDVNYLTMGTQDNGSNKWTGGSVIYHMLGADGMDCMIDYSGGLIMYNSCQEGELYKCSTGGAYGWQNIQPSGSTGPWITPLIMHPTNPSTIYGGYYDIYKSYDGGSNWTNLGYDGSGAMAIGINWPDRVYASEEGSNTIRMSTDGGYNFTIVTSNLPAGNISFIAVNPDNSSEVYVTYSGYLAADKVFRSTNAGTSWTNITGSLPNLPVNCIAFQDNNGSPGGALYIGTDVGVYYRDNDIGDWIPFMNGLPATIVMDLEINYPAGVITAATYGRGLWRSELYSACPAGYTLTPGNDPSNPNYTGYQLYEAYDHINSTRIITGGIGTDVTYQAGSYIVLGLGFHAREDNKFKAVLGPCTDMALMDPAGRVIQVTGTYTGRRIE